MPIILLGNNYYTFSMNYSLYFDLYYTILNHLSFTNFLENFFVNIFNFGEAKIF